MDRFNLVYHFEQWALQEGLSLDKMPDGQYRHTSTRYAFKGFSYAWSAQKDRSTVSLRRVK